MMMMTRKLMEMTKMVITIMSGLCKRRRRGSYWLWRRPWMILR